MSLPERHLGDRAAALVDGRLAPDERAALLEHLGRCGPCRAQYDEQRVIKGLLADLRGVEAPDDLTLRLARLAVPSLPEPGQSYLAPVVARSVRSERVGRSAARRVRLAGAGLLSVSLVGTGAAYAVGAAPVGLAVVPPVDRFVREHDHVSGGLPLSEPVLAQVLPTSAPPGPSSTLPAMSAATTSSTLPSEEPVFASAPASDPEAVRLLQRGLTADSSLAFTGTEIVRIAGTADHHLQVIHLPGRGAVVTTVGAGSSGQAVFDGDSARWNDRMLGLLGGSYQLVVGADQVFLGRPVHTVQALRADGSAAALFHLDSSTGLPLARSQYDRSGTLVRSASLTSLSFSVTSPTHLPPMLPSARTADLSTSDTSRWAAQGWPCPMQLGGLTLVGAAGVSGTGGSVLHLTYSDGLSVVSLFIQPGHLDAPAAAPPVRAATLPPGTPPVFWSARG